MANTRNYRYPTKDDDPNVPVWMDRLAQDVAADVDGVDAQLQDTQALLPVEALDPVYARAWADQSGRAALGIKPGGQVHAPVLESQKVTAGEVNGVTFGSAAASEYVKVWTDAQDRQYMMLGADGKLHIPQLVADGVTPGPGVPAPSRGPEPAWSTKVSSWDAAAATYNLHPRHLLRWTAALARATAGLGTAHITTFIDSETYGAAATGASLPKWQKSWPGRLRRLLETLTGYAAGSGIAVPWNVLSQRPQDDPRYVFGAGATQVAGPDGATPPWAGPIGRGAIQLAGANGWLTFTPAAAVNRFTIYATADAGAAGLVSVLVDGATVGTIDVSAAGGGGTLPRRAGTAGNVIVVDVPNLASGVHTLRIEAVSTATITVWGIEGGTGAGVRVSNLARSSTAVAQLVLDDAAGRYGMPLHIDTAKADLAIMMLGLNDRTNNSATFKAAVTTAVARVRAAGGDVLLVVPGQPDYVALPGDLAGRAADMYALADSLDLPLLDLAWTRKDYATANALGMYADSIHSSDQGLEHHARAIYRTITGV